MRNCHGLIEALLLVVENVIGKSDVDSKVGVNVCCVEPFDPFVPALSRKCYLLSPKGWN